MTLNGLGASFLHSLNKSTGTAAKGLSMSKTTAWRVLRKRLVFKPYRVCGKNLNIVSMCDVSPVVHTSNFSSCQKKNFFTFPVAVNNSIKVGPLVFLLYMCVITENIMKRPVLYLPFFSANSLIPYE